MPGNAKGIDEEDQGENKCVSLKWVQKISFGE